MKAYLTFRINQVARHIRSIGIGYLVLLILLTLGITTSLLAQLQKITPESTAVLSIVLTGLMQVYRKDRNFISKIGPPWKYMLIDYMLLLLPFSILLVLLNGLLAAGAVFSGLLSAFLPFRLDQKKNASNSINRLLKFIPNRYFEWKTVFRTGGIFSFLLAFIMLGVSWSIPGYCLSIFLVLLIVPTAFEYIESKELIVNAKQFVYRKIVQHTIFLQILIIPLHLIFLIFNLQYWYFVLVAILLSSGLLGICIAIKYKRYAPNRRRVYLSNIIAVYILLMWIPGFALAFIPLIWIHGRQAQKNISYYYG